MIRILISLVQFKNIMNICELIPLSLVARYNFRVQLFRSGMTIGRKDNQMVLCMQNKDTEIQLYLGIVTLLYIHIDI